MTEEEKDIISSKLFQINERIKERIEVTIIHFVADKKKEGGCYKSKNGIVKKIDDYEQRIVFDDKTKKTCFTTPVIASNFQDVIQNFNRGYVWNKIWKSDLIKHNSLKFYPGIYIEDILFSVEAANFIKKFQIIEYIGYLFCL